MSDQKAIQLVEQMWLIRCFEEQVDTLFKEGLLYGTTHLCIGQEASAVGTCAALQPGDKMTSTHRGHGHSIAHGADINKMMAELFGRVTGYCRGKGGSMHIADVDDGNLGSNGIVGGGIPIAVGSALTSHMQEKKEVTVCFFGDGATNEGSFHEALNLASIWNLPIIFVCENNEYGMSSAITDMTNIRDLSVRANSYGFSGITIDGNDLLEVMQTTEEAIDKARSGKGPTLIEAKTYRYTGHSKSDQQVYRTEQEVNERKKKDPISRFKEYLLQMDVLDKKANEQLEKLVIGEIEQATIFAKESPEPELQELFTDVYA